MLKMITLTKDDENYPDKLKGENTDFSEKVEEYYPDKVEAYYPGKFDQEYTYKFEENYPTKFEYG